MGQTQGQQCCYRWGVTRTTYGKLLHSSQHKEYSSYYVDYDLLRYRLKTTMEMQEKAKVCSVVCLLGLGQW